MELQDIKTYFDQNKDNEDVKSYLGELSAVSGDKVKGFLDTDEGKKLLQPRLDGHFTKGLETWKNNNLSKLIDEEVKKRFPEKDEKDIELEKIKAELAKIQSEKVRESLTNKAIKIANEQKLPIELVDYFIGDDEEKTTANLQNLKEVFNTYLQVAVDEKLKAGGTDIKGGQGQKITFESLKTMSQEDIAKNWDAVQQVLQANK